MVQASEGDARTFDTSTPDLEAKAKAADKIFRHRSGDHLTLYKNYVTWRQAQHHNGEAKFFKCSSVSHSILREADTLRLKLLRTLYLMEGKISEAKPDHSQRDVKILRSLTADFYLQTALRFEERQEEAAEERVSYDTAYVRASVRHTKFAEGAEHGNQWLFYNVLALGRQGMEVRIASTIATEDLILSNTKYWRDVDFFPPQVRECLVAAIAKMTNKSQEDILGIQRLR